MNDQKKVYFKATYLMARWAARELKQEYRHEYYAVENHACGPLADYLRPNGLIEAHEMKEEFEVLLRVKEITRSEYRRGRREEAHKPSKYHARRYTATWEHYLAPAKKYKTRRIPF